MSDEKSDRTPDRESTPDPLERAAFWLLVVVGALLVVLVLLFLADQSGFLRS